MRDRKRIAEELEHLIHRRDALIKRIEDLRKAYTESENAEILDLVRTYSLSPEELKKLIARLADSTPGALEKEEIIS